ncbi:MAG TPA: metallophosphoesterase family protein [bacterium]|nr:metallophosphoesterase family protein [bacterium]HOL47803.1 metallophosphoesterase family protein [bacterium]HPQ19089.1 metallophosphoesterase family protein [bacterium]
MLKIEKPKIKIIVISDSHSDPHPQFFSKLKNIDLILHCGDISSMDLIYELQEFAPVYGVHGNVESAETEDNFPAENLLEINNLQILILHELSTNLEYFYNNVILKKYPDVKLVLFGHTHIPFKKKYKDVVFFNPGAIGPSRYKKLPTYGVLKIDYKGNFNLTHKRIYDFEMIKKYFFDF